MGTHANPTWTNVKKISCVVDPRVARGSGRVGSGPKAWTRGSGRVWYFKLAGQVGSANWTRGSDRVWKSRPVCNSELEYSLFEWRKTGMSVVVLKIWEIMIQNTKHNSCKHYKNYTLHSYCNKLVYNFFIFSWRDRNLIMKIIKISCIATQLGEEVANVVI